MNEFVKYVADNIIQTGLMLVAIVTVIGSYVAGYKQEREQKAFQNTVSAKQNETIDHLKKALVEQRNLILGGDSYLYMQLGYFEKDHTYLLKYNFVGQYPLYDAKLTITETNLIRSYGKLVRVDPRQYVVDLQTVHSTISAQAYTQSSLPIEAGVVGKSFLIIGNARNGIIEEELIFYIAQDGKLNEAMKVVTISPNYESNLIGSPFGGSKRRVKKLSEGFAEELLQVTSGDHGWQHNDFERSF